MTTKEDLRHDERLNFMRHLLLMKPGDSPIVQFRLKNYYGQLKSVAIRATCTNELNPEDLDQYLSDEAVEGLDLVLDHLGAE